MATKWIALGLLALATTCQNGAPTEEPVVDETVVEETLAQEDATLPEDTAMNDAEANASGLVEREPDLCDAEDYQHTLGQPASVIDELTIEREFRVIEFGGIVTQEYNGLRINFRLDAEGNIAKVDCG